MQMILEKLLQMEESIEKVNEENVKRTQEITTLGKHNSLIETEDESPNAQRNNLIDFLKVIYIYNGFRDILKKLE